jgi:glycosyltransferase involved in cell wall biosynthesis
VSRLRASAAGRDDVLLPGYVFGSALSELYANARVFVQPSSLEGMPLTLLEAAAHGSPVVASDIPVHVAMLGHDAAGQRLFPSGSAQGLRQALGRALADLVEEASAALRLRDRVIEQYWRRVVDETEALYEELLESASRRSSHGPAARPGARRRAAVAPSGHRDRSIRAPPS